MTKRRREIADEALPPSGQLHKCSACGREDVWGPTWAWYGSYQQMENGLPVFKACSDECMAQRETVEAAMRAKASREELDRAIAETEGRLIALKRRREAQAPEEVA